VSRMPAVRHASSKARRRPAVGLGLALSLLAGLGWGPAQAADLGAASLAESASTHTLPFDLPSPGVLRASDKKVFAHYVSWSPLSLDDKPADVDYYTRNYLSPTGENGKYQAVGGKQRDRPMPRPVRAVANWRLLDMEQEVREAVAAGLDGFAVSMVQLGGSGQWAANTKLLLQAAHNVDPGFKILLRPNMISFKAKDAASLAQYIAELAAYDSAYRLGDGRLVVSPFKSEEWSLDKWKQFLTLMRDTHKTPVAFWPMFHNERTWSQTFAPISYGMANWGDRNPAWNDPVPTHKDSRLGRVAAVHQLGKKWMQPVSLSDARPRDALFDEAENTTNLRNTWQIAIDSGSEAVHIPTWNDHAEGSQIQRTRKNDGAVLDLNSYYLTWFKTGTPPPIVRDTVYLTHRTQPAAAKPTYPQTTLMANRGGSAPRDTVEALTFLTAPAEVTVSVGPKAYRCAAEAGVDTCTVPLGTGKISVKVVRSGRTTAGTTSPHGVTSSPYVQDLDYVAVSSGRQPTSGDNGAVTTSTTLVPKSVQVPASADSYANAGAPSTNYGSSTSLSSRGTTAATSYVGFDVPQAPTGTVLTKAVLRVRTSTDTAAGSVDAHRILPAGNAWAESTLNWQNRPAVTGDPLGTLPAGTSSDRTYDVPLTLSAVQRMQGTRSTVAVTGTGTDELRLASRNHSTYTRRPQLVLTYTPTDVRAADSTPPTSPGSLVARSSTTGVALTWTASSDSGSGVVGYEVHGSSVDGFTPSSATLRSTTTATASAPGTSATVSAAAGTWYFRVVAKDAEGNRSSASAQAQVVVPDTSAPTTPTSLSSTVTGSSVALTWGASKDDVTVTGYEVHRSTTAAYTPTSTTLVGHSSLPSWTQTSLPAGAWYYQVVGRDSAGNRSQPSNTSLASVASPTVRTSIASADTYAFQSTPSRNYGTSTLSSQGSPGAVSYLRFSVPAAPAGRSLTSAVLRLRTTSASGAGSLDFQTVRTAGNTWSESGLTWNNRPAMGSTVLGGIRATAVDRQYSVALSPSGMRALEGGSATLSVASTGTDQVWFHSKGHSNVSYRPQLVLTWS